MQPISIRLPQSLIETFKLLGQEHGLGYQPLMRRVLTRFAEAEMKRGTQRVRSRATARGRGRG